MRRPWLTGLLAGAGAGAIVLTLTGALHAQPTPGPTGRIACVNVAIVMSEYQRMKDFSEELKQVQEDLQLEDQQRRQKIDALRATVDTMDPDDPTLIKKMDEVLEAQVTYRVWGELKQAHSTREFALGTDRIYRDILRATEEVARAAGYDVVLHRDDYRPTMNVEEIQAQIVGRKVLYASEDVDITQNVLDKLNADWRSQTRESQLHIP